MAKLGIDGLAQLIGAFRWLGVGLHRGRIKVWHANYGLSIQIIPLRLRSQARRKFSGIGSAECPMVKLDRGRTGWVFSTPLWRGTRNSSSPVRQPIPTLWPTKHPRQLTGITCQASPAGGCHPGHARVRGKARFRNSTIHRRTGSTKKPRRVTGARTGIRKRSPDNAQKARLDVSAGGKCHHPEVV